MIKTLPTMKNIMFHSVTLCPSKIIGIDFLEREIILQNEHEFSISEYKGFGCIKKVEALKKGEILLGQVYVKHNTHHITGEPVIAIYRYVPDFYEDEELFADFYDLSYYDIVTKEMQNHADFKHLAVDSNGELVSREKWEADQ